MKHQGSTESPLAVSSPKKVKFCPPTRSSSGSCDVVSFGWSDFPVLLGHAEWDAFPLHVGQSHSPFGTLNELPKETLTVCPCAFHNKSPTSSIVDNSKQNNCLVHIIETSDSDEDIDVDVDNNSNDTSPRKFLENRVVTTNTIATRAQTQARITKRVHFTTVQVREHAVTLGDHPLAESYPVSLDWAHAPVRVMRVEDYEAKRVLRPLNNHYKRIPRARRMNRLERRVRLEQIMDVSPSALEDQERFRLLALQRESLLSGDSPCSDEDLVISLLSRHRSIADLGNDLLVMSL
jgi:hypothetical protein